MKFIAAVVTIHFILNGVSCLIRNHSCGIDNSPAQMVYEGEAKLSRYPWMGMLYYPIGKKRLGSSVVLVTRQTCLTAAYDIEKMSKQHFRARARVVVGNPCGKNEIRVRDYNFHPDFKTNTYSALALIQLETDHVKQDLRPICPPPEAYLGSQIYAMTMHAGCEQAKLRIYKMQYVDIERCLNFYRRSELDVYSMWPTHTTCARAVSGGDCLWRSGTILTMKQKGRWRLLGISVVGPGCGAPARFLDYGKYHAWVRRSTTYIGYPAITRLDDNAIVLRRTSSSIQRFGPCDYDETRLRIYSDRQKYVGGNYIIRYNLSLYANVEYACILFNADADVNADPFPGEKIKVQAELEGVSKPNIRIKRWCAGPPMMCYGFQFVDIHFHVEVEYTGAVFLNVSVFGREAKIISPKKASIYQNNALSYPVISDPVDILENETLVCKDDAWEIGIFKKLHFPHYTTISPTPKRPKG